MRYELIFLSGLAIVLLIIFLSKKSQSKYTNVKIGSTEVKAEIADTHLKRVKGLMFKKELPENEGMIFISGSEGHHGIWMMNMSFPIDIIWISKDMKVVDIVKDAQPCGLICPIHTPKEKALYILEVNSNFTQKHKIEIGSTLEFDLSGQETQDFKQSPNS